MLIFWMLFSIQKGGGKKELLGKEEEEGSRTDQDLNLYFCVDMA